MKWKLIQSSSTQIHADPKTNFTKKNPSAPWITINRLWHEILSGFVLKSNYPIEVTLSLFQYRSTNGHFFSSRWIFSLVLQRPAKPFSMPLQRVSSVSGYARERQSGSFWSQKFAFNLLDRSQFFFIIFYPSTLKPSYQIETHLNSIPCCSIMRS